ncbi:hypothetical protein ACNOYE_08985 [Nannocystaceae bacterium ST9]
MSTARVVALVLASVFTLPACSKSTEQAKQQPQRKLKMKMGGSAGADAVTANIAEFDPNADITLDMDSFGSEQPDEFAIQQAFFGQFEAIGQCVFDEKDRRKSEDQMLGDVVIAVKLNPKSSRPFGVNATMPEGYTEATKLKDCLREAAAAAPYPKWDGVPRIVEFEFELDPGSVWVEE